MPIPYREIPPRVRPLKDGGDEEPGGLEPMVLEREFRQLYDQYLEMIAGMPKGFDIPTFERWLSRQELGVRRMPQPPEDVSPIQAQIQEYELWKAPMEEEQRAAEEAAREAEVAEEEIAVPSFPTEPPPEGYRWELNDLNQWVPVFDPYAAREPAAMSEAERAQLEFTRQREEARVGEERRAFEAQQAQQLWQRQQSQQQFQLQQQQAQQQEEFQAWQQEEARRQYGAQLAAQPQSWLQYAAYAGEQPAIQPWMQPLMPQQYAGLGAGAAIPGWQAPQAGQMGGAPAQGMAGLPELTRPSRQYQARMGPTALAQYGGYQQARTGIRPEELQFRLWAGAPPGGQYQGLRYTR